MSRFDQTHLTVPAETVVTVDELLAAGVGPQDPLPPLVEPVELPAVPAGELPDAGRGAGRGDEPLSTIEHERIRVVGAYREAGWTHAVDRVTLRSGVVDRLVRVADGLPSRWGLCVFDGWRPLELQAELYAAAYADPELPPGYLAPPSDDPARPPPHLSGGSVDCTLTLDGRALALGTPFDDFTPDAATEAFESVPGSARELRRLLYWSMREAGFVALTFEWWHFEYGTRRWAALTGRSPIYGAAAPHG